jgi:hypothetical protein
VNAFLAQQHLPGEALVDFRRDFPAGLRRGEQPRPDVQHVFVQDRIIEVVGIAIQVPRNLLAQLALRAAVHLAGVTQGGKLRPHRRGQHRPHET